MAGITERTANGHRPECSALGACYISAHARCCEFEDGAIILDLRGDNYVGIDALHLCNFRARIENWPTSDLSARKAECNNESASESLTAELLARGILTNSPTPRQPIHVRIGTTALTFVTPGEERRPIPFLHLAQFSIAFLLVLLRLRLKGLESLLEWIGRRQTSIHHTHPIPREATVERLASFLWSRTWFYTAQRRCLFDSLVLSVYLSRAMIPSTFVIGVATKPFLAHAWVQIGESVLNDTAEHIQNFTPILHVGFE